MNDAVAEMLHHMAEVKGWVAHVLPQYTIPVLETMDAGQFLIVVEKAEREQQRRNKQ